MSSPKTAELILLSQISLTILLRHLTIRIPYCAHEICYLHFLFNILVPVLLLGVELY